MVDFVSEHQRGPTRLPVRVFITYSHDSHAHRERVLTLANRLRLHGVDCRLDIYEESPPQGWPQWMIDQIVAADYVLVICTETYLRRFDRRETGGKGSGVGWEGAVLTQDLYESAGLNSKAIPVGFTRGDRRHAPMILRGATFYTLDHEEEYENLYRRLTGQPRVVPPPLGPIRQLPAVTSPLGPGPSFAEPHEDIGIAARVVGRWVHLGVTNHGPTAEFVAQVTAILGAHGEQTVPWSIKWRGEDKESRLIVYGHEQLLDLAEGDAVGDPNARPWEPGGFWFYSTTARFRVRLGGLRRIEDVQEKRILLVVKVTAISGFPTLTKAIDLGFDRQLKPTVNLRDTGAASLDPPPQRVTERWVATFGVNTDELIDQGVLPIEVPGYPNPPYASLCDWLTQTLLEKLNRTVLAPVAMVEDARSGETLSVRVEFRWDPDSGWPPVALPDPYWELLELAPYGEIYR